MNTQTVGQRIRALRKMRKLTQAQLAKIAGVSAPAVTEWEKDGYLPKTVPLQALAHYFGVTTDYILSGEIHPSDKKSHESVGIRNFKKFDVTPSDSAYGKVVSGAAALNKRLATTGGLEKLIEKFIRMDSEGRLTEDFIKSIDSLVTVVEKAQETKDKVSNGSAPDTKTA